MNILLLVTVTAISGLVYSFLRSQGDPASSILNDVLLGVTLVSASLLFVAIVNLFTVHVFEKTKKQTPSDMLQMAISVVLYVICGGLIIKFGYGKDITTLLATSAVVSVVLALGLREPLGHFFSGLTLELERPLMVGDYVKINDKLGQVVAINWRAIHMRSVDNNDVIIPNSQLANNIIEVYPKNEACRYRVDFSVPNDVPPSKVLKAAANAMTGQFPSVADPRDSDAQMEGQDALSGTINYSINFFTTEFMMVPAIKSIIHERLWYSLSRNGISMARLNQGLRLRQLPGGSPDEEAENEKSMDSRIHFLQNLGAFSSVSPELIRSLAKQLVPLTYTWGERISVCQQKPDSLFIIQRGRVSVQRGGKDYVEKGNGEQPGVSVVSYPDTSHWDRRVLQQVTDNLTLYVGPVARHLVDTEARMTFDVRALYYGLAEHIDDRDERRQFLQHSPDAGTFELKAGDGLYGSPDPGGKLTRSRAISIQEAELLELAGENMAVLHAAGGPLAAALTTYIDQVRHQVVHTCS